MNREFGKAHIYVGDELIAEAVNIEFAPEAAMELTVTDYEPIEIKQYSAEFELEIPQEYYEQMQRTFGTIDTGEQLSSRLGNVFKQISLPAHVYNKISNSLNKLGRGRK